MLHGLMLGVVLAVGYSEYPVFVAPSAKVEAIIDRGPIAELIVRCSEGTAIMSYSKVDRKFCTPKGSCHHKAETAMKVACR